MTIKQSIEELTLIIEHALLDAHKKAQLKSLLVAAKEYAEEGHYIEADHYFNLTRERFLTGSVYGR